MADLRIDDMEKARDAVGAAASEIVLALAGEEKFKPLVDKAWPLAMIAIGMVFGVFIDLRKSRDALESIAGSLHSEALVRDNAVENLGRPRHRSTTKRATA